MGFIIWVIYFHEVMTEFQQNQSKDWWSEFRSQGVQKDVNEDNKEVDKENP